MVPLSKPLFVRSNFAHLTISVGVCVENGLWLCVLYNLDIRRIRIKLFEYHHDYKIRYS